MRLLLVTNQPTRLLAITALLEGRYQLEQTNDLFAAYQAMTPGHRPDAMLVDQHLLEAEDYLLLRFLRRRYGRPLPVLVLAQDNTLGPRIEAYRHGAADVLGFPLQQQELETRLMHHMELSQQSAPAALDN